MKNSVIVLEMQDVCKGFPTPYGCVEVLHQVNLTVSQGEFVAVTGPSGSGKSTLLHLAALLDHSSSGRVSFDGLDVSSLEEADLCNLRKQKVGMVFQTYCLLPHRSVFENVLFRFRYLNYNRVDAEKRSVQALEKVDLVSIANRPARLLSGGEMQRVAIARAIAYEPRLLIADEPTGNLDWTSANAIMDCFQVFNKSGITILMATHNEALLNFCTRQIVCRDGFIEG